MQALVDTGSTYLVVPRDRLASLGYQPLEKRPFALADDSVVEYDVGVVLLRLNGRALPMVCVFGDEGTEALLGAFENAGVEATLAGDITAALWSKFVFLSSFSGITCALRLPIGPIREDPDHWSLFRRAMEETFAVAVARGVQLPDDLIEHRIAFTEAFAAGNLASMYHDLVAGKRIELPWLSGAVVDMGRELGVATPVHEGFCQTLKPFVDGETGG